MYARPQPDGTAGAPCSHWRTLENGEALLRLPRTVGRRGGIAFVQAPTRVRARAGCGFGIEGKYYRAGAWIRAAELGASPVVLEMSEVEGGSNAARRGRRWEALYIVWRFNGDRGEWEEVARTSGERTVVMEELRSVVTRAIAQRTWRVVPSVEQAAERIAGALEEMVEEVEREQRGAVLAIVHDLVTAWMVGE